MHATLVVSITIFSANMALDWCTTTHLSSNRHLPAVRRPINSARAITCPHVIESRRGSAAALSNHHMVHDWMTTHNLYVNTAVFEKWTLDKKAPSDNYCLGRLQ